MLNRENTTFAEMKTIRHDWEERRAAPQSRKQDIINEYGWESEELKTWFAEKESMKFPFTGGQSKAYRAWAESVARNQDEVEMNDSCWESEWHDFVTTLRKAGVETFVVTCQSTGLMNDLFGYSAEGCRMLGLCEIIRRENRWGEEEETMAQGIRFALN